MRTKDLLIHKNSDAVFKKFSEMFNAKSCSPIKEPIIIAGPCSVENEVMIETIAKNLSARGIQFLRGGVFKPRTSPYDFQGLGMEGLKLLKKIGDKYNMYTVSEVTDTRYVETMIDYVDVLQVGSRNMHNFELLKEIGKTSTPVLLKRGMCATIDEFKMAAEYIAVGGNRKIILCERGIRTFETNTRNTLDISCVPILQQETQLPVIVDLSHSLGRKDIVNIVARAVLALGVDGIMLEVHNDPSNALSDQAQQLNLDEFSNFLKILEH